MAQEHAAVRKPDSVERRPAVAAAIHRSAAAGAPLSPIQALQQRTISIARSATSPAAVSVTTPVAVQFAKVSQPSDPAELEARNTARKVVQMTEPARPKSEEPVKKPEAAKKSPEEPNKPIQRAAVSDRPAPAGAPVAALGGTPLSRSVRNYMEPRFAADFSAVRIHTGEAAAQQSANLNAHAFTIGEHVFFGRNQYQPESASGRELIAHELTHTIQQGAAIQRSADTTVTERTPPRVQRLGIDDALNYFADKANLIPGFRLLTVVLGVNPVNMAPVERSAANILRGLLELIPITGALISQALENYGIFTKVGAWIEGQIRALGMVGGALKAALGKFLDSLSWTDIFDLGSVWERGKRIFTEPIDKLIAFGKSLAADIIKFVREAILLPLAKLAEGTRGYDLLKAVLGQDPVTGEPVPRTPETLIPGFLKLIGEEEVWENMKKANAIPRVWAWFQGALAGLMGFVRQIPTLFMQALHSLEIIDLVLPPKAFLKIANVFGSFVLEFISWAGKALWTLLEIIFDVVSPGALMYIKKTGAALKSILKNPLPFVGNLIKAAKQGFLNFADHFLEHLKAGLLDWLVGSLPGIYIPKSFALIEIAKFALSVLGLTWENIRAKLVRAIGEPAVKVLETTFDIVVTLVRDGPAAAWDKIKDQLGNLKDMVIGGITDFVVGMVVKKAIPKLIAMFIPGAGFISAILTIYDTVMVFVNKIKTIVRVVTSFIESIVQIANGQTEPAANRIESALAGVLSLSINFAAGFAGLGKVADAVKGVFEKLRAPFEKATDFLANLIAKLAAPFIAKGKALVAKGKEALGKLFSWASADKSFKDAKGHSHRVFVDPKATPPRLMVASDEMAAEAFLQAFIDSKAASFATKNKVKIDAVRNAIAAAKPLVGQIDAAQKKQPPDDATLAKLSPALLEKTTAVADALRLLVGEGELSVELKEKYLLEGLTGTYGSMPKPKADDFTADHQPQAAALIAARDIGYFDKSGNLFKRAAGRAKEGFAINLHKSRHEAGATYGSKGKVTKEGFIAQVKGRVTAAMKPEKQREVVVQVLREDLNRDVAAMKAVVAPGSAYWADLKKEVTDAEEQKKLIGEVSGRVVQGENVIANQDLDSLVD